MHVVHIGVPETANIARTNFDTLIRDPIRSFLTNNNLTTNVIALVLTKGTPYKIDGGLDFNKGLYNFACVDSDLTMLWQNLETATRTRDRSLQTCWPAWRRITS